MSAHPTTTQHNTPLFIPGISWSMSEGQERRISCGVGVVVATFNNFIRPLQLTLQQHVPSPLPLSPRAVRRPLQPFSMKILPPTNQPSWHEKRKRPVCPPCCLFPCKVSENIAKIASSRYMILHIDTSSTRPSTKERVNSAKTVLYAL